MATHNLGVLKRKNVDYISKLKNKLEFIHF